MKIQETKHRTYLVNENDQRKMIPKKYLEVCENFTNYDWDKVYLDDQDRFFLEVELLLHELSINEPYVFEKIKGKKPKKVFAVECKFAENRNEIKFGKYDVKCPIEIYKFAPIEMRDKKYSIH